MILFCCIVYSPAQSRAETSLLTFNEKYPQEKIHLSLLKDKFIAGENLWFKSYVFDGYSLSRLSTNLYLELYDSSKKIVTKKMFPLINAEGSGNIFLPEDLQEGIYYLRAYTTWMTNFSEDFQYLQEIQVYNPDSPQKLKLKENADWTVKIHPESGSFISGIPTKLAVRINSEGHFPGKLTGYVAEMQNPDQKLVDFINMDSNVGILNITPEAGKKYKLFAEDSNGNKKTFDIPEVMPSGIHLKVASKAEAVEFQILTKNPAAGSGYYTVLGTIGSQVVYRAKFNSLPSQKLSIPTSSLINGVLQLTVFDDQENVLAKRLAFVQPQKLELIKPEFATKSFNTTARGNNSFSFKKTPENINYSVLIVNDDQPGTEHINSMLSSLWLTGDFGSKIDRPAQYFDEQRNPEALDALMISEQWKRFDWAQMTAGNFPQITKVPEFYLSYNGKIFIGGKPAPNTDVTLFFTQKNHGIRTINAKSDANGFFVLSQLAFEDSVKFSYEVDTKQPKDRVQVYLQPNFGFQPFRKQLPSNAYTLVSRSQTAELSRDEAVLVSTKKNQKIFDEKIFEIEEVKIRAQKKDLTAKLNKELSSSLFRSQNEDVFDFINDNTSSLGSTDIMQWLQGRVSGLSLQSRNGDYSATYRGSPVNFFIDEIPVFSQQVSSMNATDVAMIKVLKNSYAISRNGSLAAIVIYTKRGNHGRSSDEFGKSAGLKQVSLAGYAKEETFPNISYRPELNTVITTDIRNVLYWNPDVPSAANPPVDLNFYNNDTPDKRHLLITGFDNNSGIPVYYSEDIK